MSIYNDCRILGPQQNPSWSVEQLTGHLVEKYRSLYISYLGGYLNENLIFKPKSCQEIRFQADGFLAFLLKNDIANFKILIIINFHFYSNYFKVFLQNSSKL